MTPILAFSGPSGVGKTTLLVKLIRALGARGLTVAALKHSGHAHPFDRPGKDSARLRRAGAVAVALQGPRELAYFGPPERGLRALARMLPRADVVLAEGFRGSRVPRVEVHRRAIDAGFLCRRDARVVAVVADEPPPRRVPWFTFREIEPLAAFVATYARRGRRARRRALASDEHHAHREPGHSREKKSMARITSTSRGTSRRRGASGRGRGRRGVGAATVREAGRKGGRRTLERRGPEFYSRIGRKGGKSSGGSRRAASRARGGATRGATRRGGRRSSTR